MDDNEYQGEERRRLHDISVIEHIINNIEAKKENKILSPSILVPILFAIFASIFTFVFNLSNQSSNHEYRLSTIEKNQIELKDDIKNINRQLNNLDASINQLLLTKK